MIIRPRLRRRAAVVAAAVAVLAPTIVATAATPSPAPAHRAAARADARGQLLWDEPLRTLTAAQTRRALHGAEFDGTPVRHGVQLHRLVYRTVDPAGRPATASGLVAVPTTPTRTLTPVLFEHGTVSYRPDAPSSLPEDLFASAAAIAYGAAGYVGIAPDYLGLGVGPGPHPWFDVPSETTASVDLLRAARTSLAGGVHHLGSDVLVTGFSQGASAALGVARALESDPIFRLRAVAPVSGAYAFRDVDLPALLDGRVGPPYSVAYTAYLFTAWQRLHHLYAAPGVVFRAPYADRVDTLFNGDVPGEQMIAALPHTLDALLTPAGRAMLAHPTGRFAAALRVADSVCAWHPSVPVRLYYADGDEQAITANTAACVARFRAHGAEPEVVDLGTPDYAGSRHLGSSVAAVGATLTWFTRLAPPAP